MPGSFFWQTRGESRSVSNKAFSDSFDESTTRGGSNWSTNDIS